ncbi:Endonuclease NucS [Burkholderia cepacia]|nr:Endonuclease NucS [Burkholderia cepacia]
MALFEIAGDGLHPIPLGTFGNLGLRERSDIQRAVRAHIEAITPGVRTKVIAEEFGDWAGANRRIDLLCVDEDANLVVVELKRDEGAHMDLQALRYAAMISTMRFEQAVAAHRKYLADNGSSEDPEQALREFLEVDEGPIVFTDTVRIVLASANFSSELTTAVLWLNKQGNLDIRCVQMRPHAVDARILLDIQQVIPLPQTAQYTVALREKIYRTRQRTDHDSGHDSIRCDDRRYALSQSA